MKLQFTGGPYMGFNALAVLVLIFTPIVLLGLAAGVIQ